MKNKKIENIDLSDMGELGFHRKTGLASVEFVYKVEGCKTELALSSFPYNSETFQIRFPDGSFCTFRPRDTDDIRAMQRMLAGQSFENPAEAFWPDGENSN